MLSFKSTYSEDHRHSETSLNGIDNNIGVYYNTPQHKVAPKFAAKAENTTLLQKSQANAIKKDQLNMLLNENLKICEAHLKSPQSNSISQNGSVPQPGDQWWQLFDTKRRKFFYYNPHREQSIWHRPLPNAPVIKADEKENIDEFCAKLTDEIDNQQPVVVIPLASKLIERINSNLNLLKKSKRFLKTLKKKLDIELKYDTNDLNIITTLTEQLLTIQSILTQETNPEHATNNTTLSPSSSSSTFFDLSDFEMTSPHSEDPSIPFSSPTSSAIPKLGTSTVISSPNESNSNSILLGSCYSFQSLDSNTNNSATSGTNTAKRRLQPRTNPNYINVDFINTKNGSLIKNTYIKLQDLTNNAETSDPTQNTQITATSRNSFSTVSQAVILLISILNNTSKKNLGKKPKKMAKLVPVNSQDAACRAKCLSQSSSVNTVCSLNNISLKMHMDNQCVSMNSSSATLISENSLNPNDLSMTNSSTMSRIGKKKIMTIKSAADLGNVKNVAKSYSASLTKKNLEKNNLVLKTTLTNADFTDAKNLMIKNSQRTTTETPTPITTPNSKPTVFSLFKRNTPNTPREHQADQIDFSQSFHHSTPDPKSSHSNKLKSRKTSLSKEKFTGSSSSSLADIRNISDNTQGPFNQRLQTFKRSFNKKTSFKKIKSPDVIFNNENNIDPRSNDLGHHHHHIDLNASFESHRFPFAALDIIDSPAQTKKHSQTNLLLLNNSFIDLNTSHHARRIRNGFLLFSAKKKVPQSDLLLWSNQSIQKPLIKTNDKVVKKEACDLFKLIQVYMGDRKLTSSHLPTIGDTSLIANSSFTRISNLNNGSINNVHGSEPKSSQEQTKLYHKSLVCLEIMTRGWIHTQLRDELYMQLVKQTTENPSHAALLLGWELITISLSFFPPSQKLFPFLTEYIFLHLTESSEIPEKAFQPSTDTMTTVESAFSIHLINMAKQLPKTEDISNRMAHACLKRLERIHLTGAKKGLKKPTLDEILLSRQTILSPSLFGTTLDEIMTVQKTKCPDLMLPWVQTTLSEAVLRLNGAKTEGIFRVPGDLDEVNNLKVKYDQLWCSRDRLDSEEDRRVFEDLMANIQDAHLPASLLKLWYRELYDPLIPNEFYDECIKYCDRPKECISVIQRLPPINKLVFTYLIRFLKVFAANENVAVTKMDASNLSMIMAPNCLRCKSNEPKVIMENTKKEMQFLNTLIHNLDTTCVQGLL